MILTIALVIGSIAFIWCIIVHCATTKRILGAFNDNNVIVYGKKGCGKDMLFQYVINKRKQRYYSNVDFGKDYQPFAFKDIELSNNTYENFINDNVVIEEKNEEMEGKDIYISDMGIVLPSQFDSLLHKVHPSLPIAYALSRHLWNNRIHGNTQALTRVWKSLREQADYYIKCRKAVSLPFFMLCFVCTYDKYESAEKNLLPMKKHFANKFNTAEYEQYVATNGEIKNGFYFVRKKTIHYDSRIYHKIIFGRVAPSRKKGGEKMSKKLNSVFSLIERRFKKIGTILQGKKKRSSVSVNVEKDNLKQGES